MFGGLDIVSVEAIRGKDEREYIIEVSTLSVSLHKKSNQLTQSITQVLFIIPIGYS